MATCTWSDTRAMGRPAHIQKLLKVQLRCGTASAAYPICQLRDPCPPFRCRPSTPSGQQAPHLTNTVTSRVTPPKLTTELPLTPLLILSTERSKATGSIGVKTSMLVKYTLLTTM